MSTPTEQIPAFARNSINLAATVVGAQAPFATVDFVAAAPRMPSDAAPRRNGRTTASAMGAR